MKAILEGVADRPLHAATASLKALASASSSSSPSKRLVLRGFKLSWQIQA